jgi:hypothetical protein
VEVHYSWERGGELVFRAGSLQRHPTWPAAEPLDVFEIPPRMPIFKPGELPPDRTVWFWPEAVALSLWGPADEAAAELVLVNPLELPMFVVVDRLPLARVPAFGTLRWPSSRRSRTVSFRDFLGEDVHVPRSVEIPGELALGSVMPEEQKTAQAETPGAR